jgi:hypothetical protein
MANVNVPGRFFYPRFDPTVYNTNNMGTGGVQTLDAAADYMAFILTVPKTGSLETVHLFQSQQTSIQDLHVSFQDLTATGDPDGTADQFVVYTPVGGDLNTYKAVGPITSDGTGGGARRSVTQGDRIAVVVRFNSTAGDIDILSGVTKDGTKDLRAPYAMFSSNSGTAWAPHYDWPTMMLEYVTDGIIHVPDTLPLLNSRNTVTMGNGSTPDEIGFKFQVPFPCKVVGVEMPGASTDILVGIENGAGGTIATEVSSDEPGTGSAGVRSYYFKEAEVTLAADTTYYITWRPTTATTRTTYNWDLVNAAARAGLAWGTVSSYNTRTDGGAWTEETTKTMICSLIISGIDDGAGGAPADVSQTKIQMAGSHGPIPVY